ncbi:hypothetical protein N7470_005213 [Penicillium chermesinum]|nr:hypothetical protein N7470_005213 [Penicillium chermesinum]
MRSEYTAYLDKEACVRQSSSADLEGLCDLKRGITEQWCGRIVTDTMAEEADILKLSKVHYRRLGDSGREKIEIDFPVYWIRHAEEILSGSDWIP